MEVTPKESFSSFPVQSVLKLLQVSSPPPPPQVQAEGISSGSEGMVAVWCLWVYPLKQREAAAKPHPLESWIVVFFLRVAGFILLNLVQAPSESQAQRSSLSLHFLTVEAVPVAG